MPGDPLLQVFGEASSQLQSALNNTTRDSTTAQDLEAIEITQGELVTSPSPVPASPTTFTISHDLNRVPNGAIVAEINATGGGVFPVVRIVSKTDTELVLEASTAANFIVFWVF